MANIRAFIRVTVKKKQKANVRFRIVDGQAVQLFHTSDIVINPIFWDKKRECFSTRMVAPEAAREAINTAIEARKKLLERIYMQAKANGVKVSSAWLKEQVNNSLKPKKDPSEEDSDTYFYLFGRYLSAKNFAKTRYSQYQVLRRSLRRYELYCKISNPQFFLCVNLPVETLKGYEQYLRDEAVIAEDAPWLYTAVPDCRKPEPRGQNTISGLMAKMAAFHRWLVCEGFATQNPFDKVTIEPELYGTPYYLTLEERDRLLECPMPNKALETQRDIFIFQCLIGCRVGDLLLLTRGNVIDGAIEYIPSKTIAKRADTVRVPLNSKAKAILNKYEDPARKELLPFTYPQRYNSLIKEAFRVAGLDRVVTVLNPTTRQEEKQRLCDIASSHLARRTFIGNLYSKVKDPAQISALSGHKDGSRAFARYRTIDEQQKKDLVDLID